jgi:hypothetical protein
VATRWSRALCGETAKERRRRQFPRNIINMSLVGEIRDLNLRTPETTLVSFTGEKSATLATTGVRKEEPFLISCFLLFYLALRRYELVVTLPSFDDCKEKCSVASRA